MCLPEGCNHVSQRGVNFLVLTAAWHESSEGSSLTTPGQVSGHILCEWSDSRLQRRDRHLGGRVCFLIGSFSHVSCSSLQKSIPQQGISPFGAGPKVESPACRCKSYCVIPPHSRPTTRLQSCKWPLHNYRTPTRPLTSLASIGPKQSKATSRTFQ